MEAALFPPGAKVVSLDGRAVTAHYGSVATEVAVCRKSVGLAAHRDLGRDRAVMGGHRAAVEGDDLGAGGKQGGFHHAGR